MRPAPGPYGQPVAPPLPAQAGLGWGPPPGPGPYAGTAGPEPKRRIGLMIGLIGSGVTLVLALVVGLVVVVTTPDSHSVNTPTSAAGLTRDPAIEKSIGTDALRNRLLKNANGQVTKAVSAVYTDTGATKVLFVGGEADSGSADSFMEEFTASARNTQRVDNTGGLDGKSLCGHVSSTGGDTAACVWADNDTFGQFIMLTGGDVPQLADVMKRIRPQLEKKK